MNVPQKYIQLRGYGFAAGCEAAALPRRTVASHTLGSALGSKIMGQARTRGIARTQVNKLAAGKATASAAKPNRAMRMAFEAKLGLAD